MEEAATPIGGGSGCIVRAWGCNGPVVEEGLGLDRATRRLIQQGLGVEGFDAGVADGLFGPRTRAAIRSWQSARGARSTGYLDGPQVEALRGRGGSQPSASAGAETGQSDALVIRRGDGTVSEGPFVDGEANGHWVWRYPAGDIAEGEGPYVDGRMHGNWVIRRPNGTVEEWLFRNGERVR